MEDHRFDALVKSVASSTSRRALFKGLLALSGLAVAAGMVRDDSALAARRPTPSPKSPSCPGKQTPCATGCCCPAGQEKCGPDCCATNIPSPQFGHVECCDNACCAGTCYGEELCCPTNNRSTGEFPIPPTHKICTSIDNGAQCCAFDQDCCSFDGCCDTICWGDGSFCCPNDDISFCPGGSESPDLCCVNVENTIYGCCNGGTNGNKCIVIDVPGACCTDADCTEPCQVCNPESNLCESACAEATEICCSDQTGTSNCVTGQCCIDTDCGEGGLCCSANSGTLCVDEGFCPDACSAEDPCSGCTQCIDGLCREGCGEGEDCCFTSEGDQCFEAGSCGPNLCICDGGIDCCIINGEYVCVDLTQAGVCCADADCAEFDDTEQCQVGSCNDLVCEQISTCATGEVCCGGSCISGDACPGGEEGATCLDDAECRSAICCDGRCCRAGDRCFDGVCGIENDGGQPGSPCQDHSQCLSALCCDGKCCADGSSCCDGECSDLECEPSVQCSFDSECGGENVCCAGICCQPGQFCVDIGNGVLDCLFRK